MTLETSQARALVAAVSLLDAMGKEYWLCNGTLLGLIRAGELIVWDADLDIGLAHTEDRTEIRNGFEAGGFKVFDDGAGSDYLTFIQDDIKVDLNFFAPRGGELVTLWRVLKNTGWEHLVIAACSRLHLPIPQGSRFWTLEGYALPKSAVFPLQRREFYGIPMSVPGQSEAVLEYTYGKDWRIPQPDYDWRRDGENNAFG